MSKFSDHSKLSNSVSFSGAIISDKFSDTEQSNNKVTIFAGNITSPNPDIARKMASAVEADDVEAMRTLVKSGAALVCLDPRAVSSLYITPAILYTTARNKLKVLKYLVEELEVDLSTTDRGLTAVYYAIARNYLDTLQYLIDNGAEIETAPTDYSDYFPPLKYARRNNHLSAARKLVENGVDCKELVGPKYPDYIKFGSFLQSLCSGAPAASGSNEAITSILAQNPDTNVWLEFVIKCFKNYALRHKISPDCVLKIKTSEVLPDKFKASLLNAIYQISEGIDKGFENIDTKTLCVIKVLDNFVTYNDACELSSNPLSSSPSEFQAIKRKYEQFENHKTKGFCTLHFANTPLDENLSVLAGCMIISTDIKEAVERLLNKSISPEARKLLTKALKQCNNSNLTGDSAEGMILAKLALSPETFLPKTTEDAKKEKEAKDSIEAQNFVFHEPNSEYKADPLGLDSDGDLYGD